MPTGDHILAVGDLHGRQRPLRRLLEEVWPSQPAGTRLVFLGDYLDRGRHSREVIQDLIELAQRHPETVLLMGNHESMLLGALAGRQVEMFLLNGGQETLDSYGLTRGTMHLLPAAHLDFLRQRPLYHETEEYIFVHAGLRPGLPLARQEEKDLLWIRYEFIHSDWDFGKTVVFGHTPFPAPFDKPGRIGIDTGAGFGRALTCLKLPERRFITLD